MLVILVVSWSSHGTAGWDSVGHMSLITELEEAFDVFFETEDLLALNSYDAGKKVLIKYGVHL